MKNRVTTTTLIIGISLMCLILSLAWAQELDVKSPEKGKWLDKDNKFWVYKDGKRLTGEGLRPVPPYGIPYLPYAWMPDGPIIKDDNVKLEMEYRNSPHEGAGMCIQFILKKWLDPYWCGIGFVSGPDGAQKHGPWWGETNHGWYYDLSGLRKKKFVVHMRGENGTEKVQWKVGFLARKEDGKRTLYGDSLDYPAETKWLTLNKAWTRYELDLSKEDLSRVCSLCFVVSQMWQDDTEAPVTFYIDTVYFE